MQNREVAHRFFYDRMGSFDRRSITVSYSYDKYWSYSTVIAKLTETITGKTVCLLSDNNFSMTTAKHINELRQACPFDVVYLPQRIGQQDFNAFDIVKTCIDNLEYYSNSKLSQKANRDNFSRYFYMLQNTLELKDFESQFDKTNEALDKHRELYNTINNPEKLNELKAKQKQKDKEKQQKLKKELETLLNKYSYIDLIEFAYADKWFNDTSVDAYNKQKELKAKLKQYLNPKNELSFIWFDSELVKTSQGIRVDRRETETLLKLWNNGKLKHGMTISYYTVLEVTAKYVKVGCHKIPVENLQALVNIINTQKAA